MSVFAQIIGGPASPSYDGATLTADLHVGDTVLHVDDVADFDEDAALYGGAVMIGLDLNIDGTVNAATGTVLPYLTCISGTDPLPSAPPPTDYATAVLTDAPWGYWPCGEASGATLADAASTNPMTITGTPTAFGAAGPTTGVTAVSWPSSTTVYANTSNVPATTTSFTLEGWVKLASLPGANTIIASNATFPNNGDSSTESGSVSTPPGKPFLRVWNGSDFTITGTTALSLNTWHHVVGVGTAGVGFRVRVDKTTVATSVALPAAAQNRNLFIHAGKTNGGGAAVIGQVAYYRAALSDTRIDAHYDAGIGSIPPPPVLPDTVTLTAPSTVAALAGDRVYIQNPTTGQPVGDTQVMVMLDDADPTGDSLLVSLDMTLLGGLAYPDLSNHAVELDEDEDGQLVVRNLPGLAQTVPTYLPSAGTTITGATFATKPNLGGLGVSGMSMSDDISAGVLKFYTGQAGETPGSINPVLGGGSGASPTILTQPSTTTADPLAIQTTLSSGRVCGPPSFSVVSGAAGSTFNVGSLAGGSQFAVACATGGISTNGSAVISGNVLSVNTGRIDVWGAITCLNGDLQLKSGTGGGLLQVSGASNVNGKLYGGGGPSLTWIPGAVVCATLGMNSTTVTAANTSTFHANDIHAWNGFLSEDLSGGGTTTAQVNNTGRIVRATLSSYTTSTRALKANIADLTMDEARQVLALRPRTFQDKDHAGPDDDRIPGFIAEEADEAGADLWVGRDEDTGEVAGLRYDKLTAPLVLLVRDLYDRLDALTARVAELEGATP